MHRQWKIIYQRSGKLIHQKLEKTFHMTTVISVMLMVMTGPLRKSFPQSWGQCLCWIAHQSGINAVDLKIIKDGSHSRYIVASGGDDNALNVTILSATKTNEDKTPSLVLLDTAKVHVAHSAQITGVKILDDNTVVTSSIDQRVTVWTLVMQPKLQLLMQACHCISVSDAVGLDVFTDQNGLQHLAVCGVGLQCLEMT